MLDRLKLRRPGYRVITVTGTNGKGSAVAMLEARLCAAGYRVGTYTSPHLIKYNERVRVDGMDATDAALCAAFERIESARGEIPLTYFEFGTLAAFDQFARAGINVAVLEVGLGGRLDAVNAIDADAAMVTSIGIDHVQWLGDTREAIGREKAGVFRKDRPAICADPRAAGKYRRGRARKPARGCTSAIGIFPWSGARAGMPTARGEALSAVGTKPLGWTKYHLKLGETIPLNPIYSEPAAGHGVPGASYVRGCRIRRCAVITSSTTPPARSWCSRRCGTCCP